MVWSPRQDKSTFASYKIFLQEINICQPMYGAAENRRLLLSQDLHWFSTRSQDVEPQQHVVTHEIGHHVYFMMSKTELADVLDSSGITADRSQRKFEMMEDWSEQVRAQSWGRMSVDRMLSGYAVADPEEMFAEIFAQGILAGQPCALVQDMMEALEIVMAKHEAMRNAP